MQAVPPRKRGTRIWGAPLCVGVSLPLRDADMRLNVNDPRVVAEVGRDVDRRGHNGRRIKPRGGLGAARPRRSAIAVAVVGLQRGSRYRSGVGLIAGSTARVRRTSASALTATMFSRDRSRLPTAGRAYRHSDENGSATAGVSAPT